MSQPVSGFAGTPVDALGVVQRVEALLEQEFEALRAQDLERFEALQPAKNELLAILSESVPGPQVCKTTKTGNRCSKRCWSAVICTGAMPC
jgi:hypothetical protein